MNETSRQFLRVFNHGSSQWFAVGGRKADVGNEPLTIEELELAVETSDYLEHLSCQITEKQVEEGQDSAQPLPATGP